ncbi:MAG: nucleotide pyrophosphohydrolase [Saprospiraceae bacterium]|nr:nucleotide pyrophosphohydrolase [Saprospiraceae bacterium]
MLQLQSLQDQIDQWIKKYGIAYFDELTNMTLLMEEVGELASLMSRIYGQQSFKHKITEEDQRKRLTDEIADVLFVLTCLANQMDIDLTAAMQQNIDKKTTRDAERHKTNPHLNKDGSTS